MKEEYQDKIDDYLLDRMSEEERRAFAGEVAENDELREQLEYSRSVQSAMKSRGEKLAAMQKWEDDYASERKGGSRPTMRRVVYWVSSVAAMLIVGMFLFFPRTHKPDPIIIPGGEYKGGSDYHVIDSLLGQSNYEQALALIGEEAQSVRNDSIEIVSDSTMSMEEREDYMSLIIEMQDNLKWLTVQALVGLDRKEEALSLLDELRQGNGAYEHKADSLYNVLTR